MKNALVWYLLVLIFKNTLCQDHQEVLIEKGQSTILQCNVTSNVTSVTWQTVQNHNIVNITTCNFIDNRCTDPDPQFSSIYEGSISTSNIDRIVKLNVTSARTDERYFICLTDEGKDLKVFVLNVYAWPKKVTCSQFETNTYVEYTCTADNVYPQVRAQLHRREPYLMSINFYIGDGDCTLGADRSGTEGDYSASCTWQVPMERMLVLSHFYAAMEVWVSSLSDPNNTAVISNGITTVLSLPEVRVRNYDCPVGPGVHIDSIDIGTNATCKCELISEGFPPGFARWYTQSDEVVGVEDKKDKSSTVTITYNPSIRRQSYECRPFSPLFTKGTPVTYTPKFRSSAPPTIITGLQPLILILGALCSGIGSLYA